MMRVQEAPDVLSVAQAAELLGIGRTAAYGAVKRGEIPAVRIGGQWRVSKALLLERLGLGNGSAPGTGGAGG